MHIDKSQAFAFSILPEAELIASQLWLKENPSPQNKESFYSDQNDLAMCDFTHWMT